MKVKMELRSLSAGDGREIYDMLQQMPAEENGFFNPMQGKNYEEYRAWLVCEQADARRTEIVDGWKVPQSTFWLYADGLPVGMARLRHFLTDSLLEDGGSIGYAIRPGWRGKGYGRALLGFVLERAWAMGLDRVLITVHNGNLPSIRTALANGGVIDRIGRKCHYIEITRPACGPASFPHTSQESER